MKVVKQQAQRKTSAEKINPGKILGFFKRHPGRSGENTEILHCVFRAYGWERGREKRRFVGWCYIRRNVDADSTKMGRGFCPHQEWHTSLVAIKVQSLWLKTIQQSIDYIPIVDYKLTRSKRGKINMWLLDLWGPVTLATSLKGHNPKGML